MTKEEMKNRISMTLKGPILQQGFEIICKNLTELEKENADLKALRKYELNVSKSEIEEKENAELRRDKEDLIFIRNQKAKCMGEDKEQLAKAKEIIEKLISQNRKEWIYSDVREEAEQFLKESE